MARLAISQKTIKKERTISSTEWYYLLQPANANSPDSSNYGNPPPTITDTGYSGWSTTEPTYTIGDERVLYQMVQTIFSDGSFSYTAPTISSSYEAAKAAYDEALQAESDIQDLQELGLHRGYIWYNSTAKAASGNIPAYPVGSYIASGINNTINQANSNTYGLNTWISTGGINLRYNAINLAKLTTSVLEFYYPSTSQQGSAAISLGTHNGINSLVFYYFGSTNKQMELTGSSLSFYGSNQNKAAATLTSNGLKLVEGGIEAGKPNTNDFVYISSTDFVGQIESFYRLTLDTEIEDDKTYYEYDEENDTYTAISSPIIEDIGSYYEYYTPSQGAIAIDNFVKRNWRQIIGTNFAVDSDGNLYASNADISGTINAESGSIGGFEIGNYELYSTNHSLPESDENGIYIGNEILSFGPQMTTYFTNTGTGKIGEWQFNNNEIKINEWNTIYSIYEGDTIENPDPSAQALYEYNSETSTYILTKDNTFITGKTYYIKANGNHLVQMLLGVSGFKLSNTNLNQDELINFTLPSVDSNDYMSVNILDKILINNNQLTIIADAIEIKNQQQNQPNYNVLDWILNTNTIATNNQLTIDTTVVPFINTYEQYISIDTLTPYIYIGTNNFNTDIEITNTQINFKINGIQSMYITSEKTHTQMGEFENLRMRTGGTNPIGNLTWIARSNGHLSLKVVN